MSIDPAQIAELRALNDIDDEAKTGKISHDEARAILSRFINSHFNNVGEHARASIPVDFTRDDDVRMVAYIVQMRKRDSTIDALTAERDRYRRALEMFATCETRPIMPDYLSIERAKSYAMFVLTPPAEGGRA